MKKKELLIILILAVLVTAGSCIPLLIKAEFACGWPLPISRRMKEGIYIDDFEFGGGYYDLEFAGLPFVVDFLFWFVVLAVGWWVVKKLKGKS